MMSREEKIEWLKSIPKETISPYQLSVVAGGSSYYYTLAAKDGKIDQRTMPHFWRGRNLRFWKQPIINLLEGVISDDNVP